MSGVAESAGERSVTSLRRMMPLVSLLGPQWRRIVAAAASGIGHQLVVLGTSTVAAWLVGLSLSGANAAELSRGLWLLAILVVPIAVLPWLESFLAHVAAFRVLADIRGRVFAAFERLAPGSLLGRRSGELGATAIADVEMLERFFAHTLSPLIVATVVPVGALVGLALLHWSLAVSLGVVLALLVSVPEWLRRQAAEQGDELRQRLGELSAEAVDWVQGARELLALGGQKQRLARWAERDAQLLAAKARHSRRAGLEHAATDVLTTLGPVVTLLLGAFLTSRGALAMAHLPVAVILAAASVVPVSAVLGVVRDLNLAASAADRVWAVLRAPSHVAEWGSETLPPDAPMELCFEGVGFRYASGAPRAVDGVSFEVRPGETVALAGHSGAGKSTLASLALRLWDVEEGVVRMGGRDVRQLSQETLRRRVALVPQDVYLFNTTVRENLCLGAPGASDEEVEAAARAATAHDFISELPEGYETRLGELGGRLSGGQRQRIAIARALLQDAPLLVMDEAVSSLDGEGERDVTRAVARLRRGRTSLVIAHRLSTLSSADRLIVLERGRVVEQGTHTDLLAKGGAYARLMGSQLDSGSPVVRG